MVRKFAILSAVAGVICIAILTVSVAREDEKGTDNVRAAATTGHTVLLSSNIGHMDVQSAVAGAFARTNPTVAERSQLLKWMLDDPRVNVIGWRGNIRSVREADDGGHLCEIIFWPNITVDGRVGHAGDCTVETWQLREGKLSLVSARNASNEERGGVRAFSFPPTAEEAKLASIKEDDLSKGTIHRFD